LLTSDLSVACNNTNINGKPVDDPLGETVENFDRSANRRGRAYR
jgi:hypothetical protein